MELEILEIEFVEIIVDLNKFQSISLLYKMVSFEGIWGWTL